MATDLIGSLPTAPVSPCAYPQPSTSTTWVSPLSEGRPTCSFAFMIAMFCFCLNCQEIFGLVPPVKHFSDSCVTLLLLCLALFARCLIRPIRWMDGNINGPRNVVSMWQFNCLNTHFMRYSLSLKRVKWLSKFWLLINYSVFFAKGVRKARQAWVAVKRNSKRRTIDG